MRARYESFGGIVVLDHPPVTLFVNRSMMRKLGYPDSPLWREEKPCLSAPLTAHFAVTSQCPVGCQICSSDSLPSAPDGLATSHAKRVLEILARMGVFTVAFGGGEPLARSDIFELATSAGRLGLTPTLTTNGWYLDPPTAHRCRVFRHIHVSMDGIGDVYTEVRGVDGFEYAVQAIELLVRSGVSVGINCIVSRANFDHLEELVRFLAGRGVRDVLFLRLKPSGRALSRYREMRLTPDQTRALFPLIQKWTTRYRMRIYVDCAMMPFVYIHRPDQKLARQVAAEGCVGGSEIVEIQPDGGVKACSFAQEKAGNVLQLPDFWRTAPPFQKFRQWVNHAPEPCRECEYLSLCRGGCHAIAETLTGNFHSPDPECPFVLERGGTDGSFGS